MECKLLIQDVYKITGIGAVVAATVKQGTLKINMKLNVNSTILPVKTIEIKHSSVQEAKQGDNIGFTVENGEYNLLKSLIQQEVILTEDGSIRTQVVISPEPIQPKGLFGSIKGLFKK